MDGSGNFYFVAIIIFKVLEMKIGLYSHDLRASLCFMLNFIYVGYLVRESIMKSKFGLLKIPALHDYSRPSNWAGD